MSVAPPAAHGQIPVIAPLGKPSGCGGVPSVGAWVSELFAGAVALGVAAGVGCAGAGLWQAVSSIVRLSSTAVIVIDKREFIAVSS